MGQMYLITFKTSGKSYVGITTYPVEIRWKAHSHPNNKRAIGHAFQKYGIADATLTILAEAATWDELCAMEIAAISKHGTMVPNGYNTAAGGRGSLGRVATAKERSARSALAKQTFGTPEGRARQSEKLKLHWATSEYRNKMKIAQSKPEALSEKSKNLKLAKGNPDARAAASKKSKTYWASISPDVFVSRCSSLALARAKRECRPFSYIYV